MMKQFFILLCFLLCCKSINAQWNYINTGYTDFLFGEYFLNRDTGFVFGENSRVLKTSDSGNSWIDIPTIPFYEYIDMNFNGNDTGYIVGDADVILRSIDGGNNWT